jgi:hypothetical protein
VQLRVAREEHDAHSPAAQLALDEVAPDSPRGRSERAAGRPLEHGGRGIDAGPARRGAHHFAATGAAIDPLLDLVALDRRQRAVDVGERQLDIEVSLARAPRLVNRDLAGVRCCVR